MNEVPTAAPAREFPQKCSYEKDELLAFANREFGPELPPLPLPPMLMLHRIVEIRQDGENGAGFAAAEYDILPDNFFFPVHFKNFPVLPGCMGIDGVWQLAGFYLGWLGARGIGMAISLDGGKFRGGVLPTTKLVRFEIEVASARVSRILSRVVASAKVLADEKEIYTFAEVAVGVAPRR